MARATARGDAGCFISDMNYQELAAHQYGLIGRTQLLELGIGDHSIEHKLASGAFSTVRPKVYRISGTPWSWHQDVMAACLWGGAGTAASHESAARLWELPGFDQARVEVTSSRALRGDDLVAHRAQLLDEELVTIAGIPVTSALRTLMDLGAVTDQKHVNDAVDDALRRRLVTLAELEHAVTRCGRGKRGSRCFRAAVANSDTRVLATESVFEARLLRILKTGGLPLPVPQFVIKEDGRFVARVDFAYPAAKVIIEAESYRWHSSPSALRRNTERFNRLQALGWTVIRVTWADLKNARHLVARVRKLVTPSLYRVSGYNPGK